MYEMLRFCTHKCGYLPQVGDDNFYKGNVELDQVDCGRNFMILQWMFRLVLLLTNEGFCFFGEGGPSPPEVPAIAMIWFKFL